MAINKNTNVAISKPTNSRNKAYKTSNIVITIISFENILSSDELSSLLLPSINIQILKINNNIDMKSGKAPGEVEVSSLPDILKDW